MPRRKRIDLNVKYFSERLKNKLEEMREAATVYVEAPSGYGKTTAVREFLHSYADAGAKTVWFTAIEEESHAAAWARFCKKLSQIDRRAGEGLLALGAPDADNIGVAAELIEGIECGRRTYLVIDNLQMLSDVLPRGILSALARHGGKELRLILVSQPILGNAALFKGGALFIEKADLALDETEIRAYFMRAGISLEIQQAKAVRQNTEGWIAAVYLTLLRYDAEKCADVSEQDIDSLMREVVWERLSEEAQRDLLLLAPFSRFTKQQLLFMRGLEELPPASWQTLSCRGFIRNDAGRGTYAPHAILLAFLRGLFEEQSPAYKKYVWTRAGEWNEKIGNKLAAFNCYYEARDYESLLSIDLKDVEIHTESDNAVFAIEDILQSCPEDVKLRHPMTLLSLAYKLFAAARFERFMRLCGEIESIIPKTAFSAEEKNRLFGELAMLRSFLVFNDIEKMSEQHRLAYSLIGGRARMVDTSTPWTMGCPSVLYMFHSTVGRLSYELSCMERCLPDYIRLAENHGSGADFLMRAEMLYMNMRLAEAEVSGLRAAYTAESAGQRSVVLCAGFLLARIALGNGDFAAYASALTLMERSITAGPPSMRAAHELAMAHLHFLTGRPEEVADWLKRADFNVKGLLAPAVAYAKTLHLYFCFQTGDYKRLYSLSPVFLAHFEAQRVLLPQIYTEILLSCAHKREGAVISAKAHMERALFFALPDGLIAPFAELSADAPGILSLLPHEAESAQLRGLGAAIERGRARIKAEAYKDKSPYALTAREHEIAALAAQRKSNIEIAELACISVATVRTHLRTAYNKMGIDTNSKKKRNLLEQRLEIP